MTPLGTYPTPRAAVCDCGQPLEIEMERDHGQCVDCQSRHSILRGMALTANRIYIPKTISWS